jgi:D-inositol-3-phosphate glycosyltransferase
MTDIICDLPVKTIAVLSFHSCPLGNLGARDTGGMSVYIREVAVEIARMGFKLDIFTRRHNNHDTETMQLARGYA